MKAWVHMTRLGLGSTQQEKYSKKPSTFLTIDNFVGFVLNSNGWSMAAI